MKPRSGRVFYFFFLYSQGGTAGARLRAAVEMGLKGKMRVPDMPLVGMGIKGDTFTQGFRKIVKRAGVEWFVFHDIKAKGVSDFTGDKRKAGGHKSEKMVDVYDRKRMIIEATE